MKFCFASSLLLLKQLRSFFLVFSISGLVSLESFVKSFFSSRAYFGSSPKRWVRSFLPMKATAFGTVPTALIATLAVLYKSLDVFCEDFLILEVLLQRDCFSHREGELHVVHCIPAGVSSKVFLDCLFCNPADGGSQVSEHCSIENSLSDITLCETLFLPWDITQFRCIKSRWSKNIFDMVNRFIGSLYSEWVGNVPINSPQAVKHCSVESNFNQLVVRHRIYDVKKFQSIKQRVFLGLGLGFWLWLWVTSSCGSQEDGHNGLSLIINALCGRQLGLQRQVPNSY